LTLQGGAERLAPVILPSLAAISTEVWVAVIAAVSSVLGAVVTGVLTRRNNAALKKLEEIQEESKARISYNYEARKRLYAVCEPLLFQATEQAVEARARIRGLAKAARGEQLRADGSGWLDTPEKYFFRSTVYNLLTPMTSFSILQRRLTTIDLGLDTGVRAKYETLKLIFFSFKNDWNLAEWGGGDTALKYDRNKTDPGEPDRERLLRDSPQEYAPQGLYRAMLYVVAEAFMSSTDGARSASAAVERCITFGEFQGEWDCAESERMSLARRSLDRLTQPGRSQSTMAPVFDSLVELFGGFHPERKPVLWRLLISQYFLYGALLSDEPELVPLTEEEIESFDWRCATNKDEDFRQPLAAAEGFVNGQLATLRQRLDLESN
jgi:hypothetical protein